MTASPGAPGGGAFLRQLRRLLGEAGGAASPSSLADHRRDDAALARLEARLGASERTLAGLADRAGTAAPVPAATDVAALAAAVAALEKQIGRAGREQLKANALAEDQGARLAEALDALRAADARREADHAAARAAARLEVVRAILPALDGLDAARCSGQQLLARPVEVAPAPGFLARLFAAPAPPAPDVALRDDLAAWLTGLDFVRARLLAVLEAEGVRPMEAAGRPFDPHRHVALEVVAPDTAHPPGTVVAELRHGYLVGDRPLRHAEVVVSRDGGAER